VAVAFAGLAVLALGGVGFTLLFRAWSRSDTATAARAAATVLAFSALSGIGGRLVPVTSGRVLGLFMAIGACAGVILWANVNARRVRGFNLLSLGVCLVAAVAVEAAARASNTGQKWHTAYAWEAGWSEDGAGLLPGALQDLDDLETGKHPAWPDRGYPVAFGPKNAPLRIVAFGGSSTAGAWQNDRMDQFYPAFLEDLLTPDVEVVNQGVGGWTTFQIRRYAERELVELAPDIVTVYAGNNDCATGLPVSLENLSRQRQARRGISGFPNPFRSLVTYQGLAAVLFDLRGSRRTAAVSPEEQEHNMRVLARLVQERGGRLLLLSEGVKCFIGERQQDCTVGMGRVAADTDGVAWLDANALLTEAGDRMFLDCNHLSEAGHRFLAKAIAARLRELGWVGGG